MWIQYQELLDRRKVVLFWCLHVVLKVKFTLWVNELQRIQTILIVFYEFIVFQWLAGVKAVREEMEAGWEALMMMKKKVRTDFLDDDNDG